ncbi:uncharacterized protein CC84DRAFT_1258310 [Paraphaeosphaeria sporulosa]|uniref:Uncharacterized protein n=1 Tax=Paraphaeosphaeria sporulosa TaxID=1460663 RepID=A0A177CK04_9PLEO|nr:uncharacterized protein CC84DRAFT_1258310 [Paraphaeosphaeria sporulosa]OAG07127.1 hypothetical protein CC84DRAFT_1258310 [Paraphaeosphaeria sporulosa]
MAAPQTVQAVRRWILTGSVAAITVTGALYGADLKSSYEKTQAQKRIATISADEKIAHYQSLIEEWERTKKELERKLENFQAKKRGEQSKLHTTGFYVAEAHLVLVAKTHRLGNESGSVNIRFHR